MTLLAAATFAVSALALLVRLADATAVPLYVSVAGLALGAVIHLSRGISTFLRAFVVLYGLGFAVLVTLLLAAPLLGPVASILPPPLAAMTAAAFGFIAFGVARLPVMQRIGALADPYFESRDVGTLQVPLFGPVRMREAWIGFGLMAVIIGINLAQVAISVRLSFWSRDWFDAIQNKNAPEFWRLLLQVWVWWVAILIASNVIEFLLVAVFKIRWRDWLTRRLAARWLDDSTHYRLGLLAGVTGAGARPATAEGPVPSLAPAPLPDEGTASGVAPEAGIDNPDQRIADDVRKYVDTTYSLTISLIQQVSSLVSFAAILWGLSVGLTLPGTQTQVPGLLFWIALGYAILGTFVTHMIGRSLVRLNFEQERYEADFRFSLARLREYAEPVALIGGERAEKERLGQRFGRVISNYFRIVSVQKWLTAFIQLYGSSTSVVPYIIVAPFYFAGQVTLGVMNQTAGAFARVEGALAFFIDRYTLLADYFAVINRLTQFDASIALAQDVKVSSALDLRAHDGSGVAVENVTLELPDGREIVSIPRLEFRKSERTLVVGPSGSGKSTLFRAIAGIWPFGRGEIGLPRGASVLLLPQRPYLPIGPVRDAVAYPAPSGTYADDAVADALRAVHLPHLADRLDIVRTQGALSLGEQQRLAVARALLAKPDWLFLDEATASLDEPLEEAIYRVIAERLPGTTVVSIGHRSTLQRLHDRRIEMVSTGERLFTARDTARVPEPA